VWLLAAMFVVAGAAIWAAGIQLSDQTDVLTMRLGLGSALGGLIMLAIATNLPEIAIVAAAAVSGNIGVAVGNILGGIAIQTVVLVAIDAFGVRGSKPLTYRAASLVLVLEAALVVAVLAIVIGGTQLPATLITARLTPAPVLILMVWVLGLVLSQRAGRSLPWQESGQPPDCQQQPRGHRIAMAEQQATAGGTGTARAAVTFGFAAAVTLTLSPITSVCPVCCSAQPCWPRPPRCPNCPLACGRCVMATTSSRYPTSSAGTPSCRCFLCLQRCCRDTPCCRPHSAPTSISRRWESC
jgi:cation:H+ antiporter